MLTENRFTFRKTVLKSDPLQAVDFLALHTGLSKARIKDAMNKGAVWLQRRGRGRDRFRRATGVLKPGDLIELFYDKDILSLDIPRARCVLDTGHYSIWDKPAGVLSQGTEYGDHCSLLRQVQEAFTPRRQVFPVHRLDRETRGLVVVAHHTEAASRLSRFFRGRDVVKSYRAEVLGVVEGVQGCMDKPLNGKAALTRYTVISVDREAGTSRLHLQIETGRLHQIRRHLSAIGHPVMGDPRYGALNKDGKPMRLCACGLVFKCPFTGQDIRCEVEG